MITLFIISSYNRNQFIDVYLTKYFIHARGDNLLRRFLLGKVFIMRVNFL